MITRLNQLTLAKFVDLVCGDKDVLCCGEDENDHPTLVATAIRNIIMEYRVITDPGGTEASFRQLEEWIKAKIKVILFTMCANLVELGQYARVRVILSEYGFSVSKWTDNRVSGTVQAELAKAQRKVDELEAESKEADEDREKIRSRFDEQTAAIMAHFKFQIDPATINATLYANLVALCRREINARNEAMSRK